MSKKKNEVEGGDNDTVSPQVTDEIGEKQVVVEMLEPFLLFVSGYQPRGVYLQKGQSISLTELDVHNLTVQRAQFKIIE